MRSGSRCGPGTTSTRPDAPRRARAGGQRHGCPVDETELQLPGELVMTHAVREMHAMLAASADPAGLAYQTIPRPGARAGRTAGAGAGHRGDLRRTRIPEGVSRHPVPRPVGDGGRGRHRGRRVAGRGCGLRADRFRPARCRRRVRDGAGRRRGRQASDRQPRGGRRRAARRAHRLAGAAHPRPRAGRPACTGPRRSGRGGRLRGPARRRGRRGGDRHRLRPRRGLRRGPRRQPGRRLHHPVRGPGQRRRPRHRSGRRRGHGPVLGGTAPRWHPGRDRRGARRQPRVARTRPACSSSSSPTAPSSASWPG